MEDQYQNDADIVRVQHFDYYAQLLTEYYHKNGNYPFQHEKDGPVYVFIMTNVQESRFKDTNPNKHYTINDRFFFDELSIGLNRTIDEKYDPQKVAGDSRPTMYIYMVDGDNFYFAIHLYNDNIFTKTVAKYYHKMELSNEDIADRKLYTYETLKNDPQYEALLGREANKQGFFDELDAENKNNSNAGKFEFGEMFFSHNIANGETTIIFYNIPDSFPRYSEKYTSLYHHFFNTEQFLFSEEGYNDDRGFLSCRLLLKAKVPLSQNENLTALLSKILGQEVSVGYMERGEMTKNAVRPWSITFPLKKNMYLGNTTNAIGRYQNERLSKTLLVFDLEKQNEIEFVLGYK